jgi:replicative DNA helicase Mcm
MFVDANSYESLELEFEEVQITKEDENMIMELSKNPDIYNKIRDSIAPHIYGYNEIRRR